MQTREEERRRQEEHKILDGSRRLSTLFSGPSLSPVLTGGEEERGGRRGGRHEEKRRVEEGLGFVSSVVEEPQVFLGGKKEGRKEGVLLLSTERCLGCALLVRPWCSLPHAQSFFPLFVGLERVGSPVGLLFALPRRRAQGSGGRKRKGCEIQLLPKKERRTDEGALDRCVFPLFMLRQGKKEGSWCGASSFFPQLKT